MLDDKDLMALQKMMDTTINKALEQNSIDLKRDLRDEMHAMERRLIHRMDKLKAETVSEVTDFIGGTLLPQIDELQTDVLVLRRHR